MATAAKMVVPQYAIPLMEIFCCIKKLLTANDAAFKFTSAFLSFGAGVVVMALHLADDHRLHLVDCLIEIGARCGGTKILLLHVERDLGKKDLSGAVMLGRLSKFNARKLALLLRFEDPHEFGEALRQVRVDRIGVFNIRCLNGGTRGTHENQSLVASW